MNNLVKYFLGEREDFCETSDSMDFPSITLIWNFISFAFPVNDGDYVQAVMDRNLSENITRVLYPNDNVRIFAPKKIVEFLITVIDYLS